MSPRETPRQAKVRRMTMKFIGRPGNEPVARVPVWLFRFGLEVWQAARRQTIRELGAKRSRTRLVERARKAGL